MDQAAKRNSILAGLLVVVAAVGYFIWKGNSSTTCRLTGAGVALVSNALLQGKTAAQIAGVTVSGVLIPEFCEEAIEAFIERPNDPVTLEVDSPAGSTSVTTTGTEVLNPAPQPSIASLVRQIQCRRHSSDLLFAWCLEGHIGPPPQFGSP